MTAQTGFLTIPTTFVHNLVGLQSLFRGPWIWLNHKPNDIHRPHIDCANPLSCVFMSDLGIVIPLCSGSQNTTKFFCTKRQKYYFFKQTVY